MSGFTFETLRQANVTRLPRFKNAKGEVAHKCADGSDWTLAEWCNAMGGEVGELSEAYLLLALMKATGNAGNLAKKFGRGDLGELELREKIAGELADVGIYLDLLAFRCGIDLGSAIYDKFNEVSVRVGANVFLDYVPPTPNNSWKVFVRDQGPANG